MNIKTLEVIHTLLIENSTKAKADYKNARGLQHVYEGGETRGQDCDRVGV